MSCHCYGKNERNEDHLASHAECARRRMDFRPPSVFLSFDFSCLFALGVWLEQFYFFYNCFYFYIHCGDVSLLLSIVNAFTSCNRTASWIQTIPWWLRFLCAASCSRQQAGTHVIKSIVVFTSLIFFARHLNEYKKGVLRLQKALRAKGPEGKRPIVELTIFESEWRKKIANFYLKVFNEITYDCTA